MTTTFAKCVSKSTGAFVGFIGRLSLRSLSPIEMQIHASELAITARTLKVNLWTIGHAQWATNTLDEGWKKCLDIDFETCLGWHLSSQSRSHNEGRPSFGLSDAKTYVNQRILKAHNFSIIRELSGASHNRSFVAWNMKQRNLSVFQYLTVYRKRKVTKCFSGYELG